MIPPLKRIRVRGIHIRNADLSTFSENVFHQTLLFGRLFTSSRRRHQISPRDSARFDKRRGPYLITGAVLGHLLADFHILCHMLRPLFEPRRSSWVRHKNDEL